jgi:aspartate carbamoyltransferase catalytic subunit
MTRFKDGSALAGPLLYMTSTTSHLVSIDDLSREEIRALFVRADEFASDLRAWSHLCPGLISASLFYEPSTRTRLSFESAMLRLGGGVLTAADMRSSSASKGESLADTVRVVGGGYADLIVLRHASEGAARLAAQYSPVPVINAGDGSHEHPTQTLCDLYNLWIERGRIEGLEVVLSGDLRYSRTIHSFVYALARFGANIVCVPQHGFELPDYVVQRLREEFDVEPVRADVSRLGDLWRESDAVYLTPKKPHQLSLFTDARGMGVERVDALYMTRPQTERHGPDGADDSNYLQIGKQELAAESLRDAVVMHPLPRRDEISSEVDGDPRSIYFKQSARGVPIRMAILGYLLGRIDLGTAPHDLDLRLYEVRRGENPCVNPSCISHTESRHVRPHFKLASRFPRLRAYCGFCSQELPARWVGCTTTGSYHPIDAPAVRKIRPDHLVFLRDEEQARGQGFTPISRQGAVH